MFLFHCRKVVFLMLGPAMSLVSTPVAVARPRMCALLIPFRMRCKVTAAIYAAIYAAIASTFTSARTRRPCISQLDRSLGIKCVF